MPAPKKRSASKAASPIDVEILMGGEGSEGSPPKFQKFQGRLNTWLEFYREFKKLK